MAGRGEAVGGVSWGRWKEDRPAPACGALTRTGWRGRGPRDLHLEGDRIRYTPSDLTVFLESEFASWMDRWALARRAGGASALPVPGGVSPLARVHDLPLFATAKPAP